MTKYLARILPDFIKMDTTPLDVVVPLIEEHNIWGDRLGDVELLSDNMAYIFSDDERVQVGVKLSAGSFIGPEMVHYVREVSVTKSPKYPVCEILEVVE